MAYERPLPQIGLDSRPYWEAARRHELRLQRCRRCGRVRFRPRPACPACLSEEADWERMSGRGRVWSWIVLHETPLASFKSALPLVLAEVRLDEGPRMTAELSTCGPEDVRPDMPVEVWFDDVTPEVSLPKFRPAESVAR